VLLGACFLDFRREKVDSLWRAWFICEFSHEILPGEARYIPRNRSIRFSVGDALSRGGLRNTHLASVLVQVEQHVQIAIVAVLKPLQRPPFQRSRLFARSGAYER
jgi:hypothetical protein